MEQIGLRSFLGWFIDEARDFVGDFMSLYGIVFLTILLGLLTAIVPILASRSGGIEALFASLFVVVVHQVIIPMMMLSFGKARLHERQPNFADLVPPNRVLLQAVATFFVATVVSALPVLLMAPALAMQVMAGDSLLELGVGPMLVAGVFSFFLSVAMIFAPSLVVDRRITFLEAVPHSFACVLRDPLGVGVFWLAWCGAWVAVAVLRDVLGEVSPMLAGAVAGAMVPALWTIRMRAHRAYFGLGPDWVLEEELREKGYYEMMEQNAEERRSRASQEEGGAHGSRPA